ncbi:uncharacterized protein [Pempheris klunzingeri]|uniref:uncharacterized protein n=1 Tax=Pempheris klunzingeri TaxID=3127111 RepID=UPI0039816850
MKLHWWSILLLCLSAKAENTAVYREPGEVVTLVCSSAGCPSSTEGYNAMYLYHSFTVREEVFYYYTTPGSPDKITPRKRYMNRIQTNGSLKNHTITFSNLTVNDSGIYSCVYKRFANCEVQCNVYSLIVRGAAPCSRSAVTPCSQSEKHPCARGDEKSLPLVFIIIATTIISILVTTIFILLIIPKVKRWIGGRRRPTSVPQASNDYVYEVMTKNGLRPSAAPEQQPYDFA